MRTKRSPIHSCCFGLTQYWDLVVLPSYILALYFQYQTSHLGHPTYITIYTFNLGPILSSWTSQCMSMCQIYVGCPRCDMPRHTLCGMVASFAFS
ncbi:hypothetical protein BD779DRAFT_1581244 [Infundibulicybe gibba]|nr:hypothetical protein BD779DRAFT_1589783 [Infundibulicybe gibba]KAF8869442.1 hypothetical protein BD779DRAFT_1586476 [Infundibulicybe gibba]KAF8870302.1 hypothetical protein BD779DRAFT_1581244 [Infundibulicybe gibba]